MSDVIYTEEYKDFTITIHQDSDYESPREWDNLGTMTCWHRRYNLGDKHKYQDPDDFKQYVTEKTHLILPLFLYDHSGITMNTTGFTCRWDSGQVGYYHVSKEKIRQEYSCKRISKKTLEKVRQCLISEVKTYDQYLTGEVYGYVIKDKTDEENETESCWGFYGYESNPDKWYVVTEARSVVDYMEKKKFPLLAAGGVLDKSSSMTTSANSPQ